MPKNMVIYYNQIDIGIFLCFLELCLEHNKINYKKDTYRRGSRERKQFNSGVSHLTT